MIDYGPLFEHVQAATGLTFPQSRLTSIKQIFADAITKRGLKNADALVAAMQTDAALRDMVVAKLTVGETYFFRDPRQFDVVRESILPDIVQSKAPSSMIRMWSAASASGEEAYTLAIILEESGAADRGIITATDIARPRLASAQRGHYKKWSLRGVDDATVARYFTRTGDTFALAPRLLDRVSFKYLNLAEDAYPSLGLGIFDMDLIMCRNVLIYFDEVTVTRVAQRLIDSLSRTGWLLIGASDPPISHLVDCDVVTTPAGLAYRRPGAGGNAAIRARVTTTFAHPEMTSAANEPALDAMPAPDTWAWPEAPTAPAAPRVTSPLAATAAPAEDGDGAAFDAAVRKVRELCNTGDTGAAATLAMHELESHGNAPELHYLLAVALSHEDQNAGAIRAARRALYLDRGLVIAHVLLGQLYARMHDTDAAVRSFRNAADLLAEADASSIVAATDGERAGRIREVVAVHLRLLRAA